MSEENMNNTAVEHEYGADQIQILEGLEAVRKRQECILVPHPAEDCITWCMRSLIMR